jgi:hypothetical protein
MSREIERSDVVADAMKDWLTKKMLVFAVVGGAAGLVISWVYMTFGAT